MENGSLRTIPFECMVVGDKTPVYEETLEDNGCVPRTLMLRIC